MSEGEKTRDVDSLVNNLEFKMTENERAQLMTIAIRHALIWGTIATTFWYVLWFSVANDEPA
jgi:fatty acid desaturase